MCTLSHTALPTAICRHFTMIARADTFTRSVIDVNWGQTTGSDMVEEELLERVNELPIFLELQKKMAAADATKRV